MGAFSIALLITCVSAIWSARFPRWPQEFRWRSAGPVDGWTCTRILEVADPDTWDDNYFCYRSAPHIRGIGMRWSSGGPIRGMKCTQITERQQPPSHTWDDNFLCVPRDSPFNFVWSEDGPISGKRCIEWKEIADPNWNNNFLCRN